MSDDAAGGFRLDRFELLNWGTFHEQIWVLEPKGETSLLTGRNGSGKSTLVDGLITLLVPNSHSNRSYNQAAGSEQKRERTEVSYVQGAYAQTSDTDAAGRDQTLKLRPKDTYTVLLATFINHVTEKTITLAQVLAITGGDLSKFYVVAQDRLSIREHFQLPPSGRLADLRTRLRKTAGVTLFDTFKDYSAQLRRHFHLRSDKALSLFNQIVSMKEVGDLNQFVRRHMLEETDVKTAIETLRSNYHDLTTSYNAIIKAKRQLAMLQPLVKEGHTYQTYTQRIDHLERQLSVLPYYFDALTLELLAATRTELEQQIAIETEHQEQINAKLKVLRQNQQELFAALQNDTAVRRIQELEREINHLQGRLADKQSRARAYQNLTQQLQLAPAETPEQFIANQQAAQQIRAQADQHIETAREEQSKITIDHHQVQQSLKTLKEDIEHLRQHRSQIPRTQTDIRKLILQHQGIAEEELPFIGELLQVRDTEYQWEPALQGLLNGFALNLIVPESYYHGIRAFIDRQFLNGRLFYHRIQKLPTYVSDTHLRPESVVFKLQIRPDTPYENWLKERLIASFDYVCCDSLEQFDHEERALTRQGQIKHSRSRHEKNDRKRLNDPSTYVLGWNNEQKIRALTDSLNHLNARGDELQRQLKLAQAAEHEARHRSYSADELLKYTEWGHLNTHAETHQIAQYQQEIQGLRTSSDTYRTLQQQYAQIEQEISQSDTVVRQLGSIITTLQNDYDRCIQRAGRCTKRLQDFDFSNSADDFERIRADISTDVTLDGLEDLQRSLSRQYENSRDSYKGQQTRTSRAIQTVMEEFARAYPQETVDVGNSIAVLPWYLERVRQLENDDLPAHEERFRLLLHNNVRQSMNVFRSQLESREGEIRKRIEQLNQSLGNIAYTSSTYIRLIAKPTQYKEVIEFRRLLRDSYVNVGVGMQEDTENQRVFEIIRQIIERFETDTRWRDLVTDVRNWLDFSAEERLMSDHSVHEYYQSSSGKSGGQKAKLAYTILASAIADQYGLNTAETRAETFRFVVIDEVFSKSDEMNSRFAMELFRQLGLQVLVVTPADKIQIVEPYIGSCHYVSNSDAGNCSEIQIIAIEHLRDLRRREPVS